MKMKYRRRGILIFTAGFRTGPIAGASVEREKMAIVPDDGSGVPNGAAKATR